VRTDDGEVHEAERWLADKDTDVAVLKIDVKDFPYLDVETSVPKLGEEILVVGYPLGQTLGIEPAVTKGIVSAVRFGNVAYQLDAAVNPGNSGGPVLNKSGDVLGIVSFKVRGAEGIAFAVSAKFVNWNPLSERLMTGPNAKTREGILRDYRNAHIEYNRRPPLSRAADVGDLPRVERLLAAGAKADIRDESGCTPLMYAAALSRGHPAVRRHDALKDEQDPRYKSRKLQIAKLLVENGADVNAVDEGGESALHSAARGFADCVKLLIQHGANVNQSSVSKTTPLWWAYFWNDIDSAELLINSGADVNARNLGRTMIGWAYSAAQRRGKGDDPHYHDKMIDLLREHGATE
jgi:hypothetical protein